MTEEQKVEHKKLMSLVTRFYSADIAPSEIAYFICPDMLDTVERLSRHNLSFENFLEIMSSVNEKDCTDDEDYFNFIQQVIQIHVDKLESQRSYNQSVLNTLQKLTDAGLDLNELDRLIDAELCETIRIARAAKLDLRALTYAAKHPQFSDSDNLWADVYHKINAVHGID